MEIKIALSKDEAIAFADWLATQSFDSIPDDNLLFTAMSVTLYEFEAALIKSEKVGGEEA